MITYIFKVGKIDKNLRSKLRLKNEIEMNFIDINIKS